MKREKVKLSQSYITGVFKRINRALEKEYHKLLKKDHALSRPDAWRIVGDFASDVVRHWRK